MTTNKFFVAAVTGAMMFLTACDVKDTIYESSPIGDPDKGKITLTMDWSNMGAEIDTPGEYTVTMGSHSETFTQASVAPDKFFDPGTYSLYVYNTPGNPSVSGTTATADYTAGVLGWLFTSVQSVTVEADRVHELTAVMRQQVRQLTLVIEPTGGAADKIESITATLSGAAGSYDMESDAHGAPTNVMLDFTKQVAGDFAGKWTATVRLLGVAGAEQKLTGAIRFTGGTPEDIPLESDLTSDLSTFNELKNDPQILGGTLAETPDEAGFTATITDWTKITVTGDAEMD